MAAGHRIAHNYCIGRARAAALNVPYRPYSPLLNLLNNPVVRNLVMEFFHAGHRVFFDRDIVPEDIFHIFNPIASLYPSERSQPPFFNIIIGNPRRRY